MAGTSFGRGRKAEMADRRYERQLREEQFKRKATVIGIMATAFALVFVPLIAVIARFH